MPSTVVDGTIPTTTFTILPAMRKESNAQQQTSSQPDDPACPADPRYEADWSQQMAADGCTDLPVSWYRQTPWNAVTRPHGMANLVFVALFTLGTNLGLGYLLFMGADQVGVWQTASGSPQAFSLPVVADFLLTVLVMASANGWTARLAGLQALKNGWTVMVDPQLMTKGCCRLAQVRLSPSFGRGCWSSFLRGLLYGLIVLLCFGLPFLIALEVICTADGMHGHGTTCHFSKVVYVWVKSAYLVVVMSALSPLVLLMGISASSLTDADRAVVVESQRQRWKAR